VLFTDGVDASSSKATYESTIRTAEELDAMIFPILYDTYDPSIDNGGTTSTSSGPRLPGIFGKIPLPLPFPSGGSGNGGGPGSSRADYDRGEQYLRSLADLTGGRVYEARRDLSHLRAAFKDIAEELGRQYSLGYYPKQPGKPGERRQLKVRVTRADVAVRSRDSYIRLPSTTPPKAAEDTANQSTPPVLKKQLVVERQKEAGDQKW
jgi:VWFA-related protein